MIRRPPRSTRTDTLFPYPTLFRSHEQQAALRQFCLLDQHPLAVRLLPVDPNHRIGRKRSEEHTSELQSLMRISYAVFCWKKKKNGQSITIKIRRTRLKQKLDIIPRYT